MKYIGFKDITPAGRKTLILELYSTDSDLLGEIRFWGAWRQYTFHPESDTIFDIKCLTEINEKLTELNTAIRNEWKERKRVKQGIDDLDKSICELYSSPDDEKFIPDY